VPIDFSYTTSYRLFIVTFALGRTVWPQYITLQTDRQTTDDRRNSVAIARPLVRSAKNGRIRKLGPRSAIRVDPLSTHYRPCGRHLGDLFRLHLSDPVLLTLTYVFSSILKSAQNFDDIIVTSEFLWSRPNAFSIKIASAREPICLPACNFNKLVLYSLRNTVTSFRDAGRIIKSCWTCWRRYCGWFNHTSHGVWKATSSFLSTSSTPLATWLTSSAVITPVCPARRPMTCHSAVWRSKEPFSWSTESWSSSFRLVYDTLDET